MASLFPRRAGRRHFLKVLAGAAAGSTIAGCRKPRVSVSGGRVAAGGESDAVELFLAGDVMTGRGIDQVLPHPGDPELHEPYMKDARGYVEIAERRNGPIPYPVPFDYVWGDALAEWRRAAPDVRVINLETAVTTSDDYWPGKGIHYRMHPDNLPVLGAAGIDCCVLANNHLLDWGVAGIAETLRRLRDAGLKHAGAGATLAEAAAPAALEIPGRGRLVVVSFGLASSGIPYRWGARADRPGVWLLPDLSRASLEEVAGRVGAVKRERDIVVASIHWGENWGYEVPADQQAFAQALIDEAGVDVVHGHSSHHPKALAVYRDKPILYGCGDFFNDYEGIGERGDFRSDLSLMYFLRLEPVSGRLLRFDLVPMRIARFRLNRASAAETAWLRARLEREYGRFGVGIASVEAGRFTLQWT